MSHMLTFMHFIYGRVQLMTKKTYYIPVIAVMAILACCFIISSYYQSRIDKIKNMYENKLATAGSESYTTLMKT